MLVSLSQTHLIGSNQDNFLLWLFLPVFVISSSFQNYCICNSNYLTQINFIFGSCPCCLSVLTLVKYKGHGKGISYLYAKLAMSLMEKLNKLCFFFFREKKPFQSAQFRLSRLSAKVCGTFLEPSRSSPTTRSTSSRSRTGVMLSSGCSVCRSLWRARRKGMKIFRLSIHAFPPCQTQDPALVRSLWPAHRQNYSVCILLNGSHTFWPIIFLWNL